MAPHVYARLSGFGWILVPRAPFRVERLPGRPRSLLARHDSPAGPRQATISLEEARPVVELGSDTAALNEVLDLLEGPVRDHWRIETTVFTARWPESFALTSAPSPGPPFDLHGPDGALVFVQGPIGPARLPALTAMAGPGQKVKRHGSSPGWGWVELEYTHEGIRWRQTHRVLEDGHGYALVVTAQTPERWAELTDAAAEVVAGSLRPYDGE